MKIKDMRCEELKCTFCPFVSDGRLRFCTSFKLNETLGEGLERNKKFLDEALYEKICSTLDVEVTDKHIQK